LEALEKIIRLLANLLVQEEIGLDLIANKQSQFRLMLGTLMELLVKTEGGTSKQITVCILQCFSNLTFYNKLQIAKEDFAYREILCKLTSLVSAFVMQANSEEICSSALRVVANLSRHKELIKYIIKFKIIDGVVMLLETNSLEIAFNALGVLVNVASFESIKQPSRDLLLTN